jgi:hypothetical protein
MNRSIAIFLSLVIVLGVQAAAQDAVNMDDESHYSRVFANDKCRVYEVNLRRLEETKAVVHEHDWARIEVAGIADQAWDSNVFAHPMYEDPDTYFVQFLYPVKRLTLRNPRNEPYRALIIEIMKYDDSDNRVTYDPSLDFRQKLGPGVETRVSYMTVLTKTSVEIRNVQLLSGDSKELHPEGTGALLVAMTDLELTFEPKNGRKEKLELARSDVRWLADATGSFKNEGKDAVRFAIFGMK